MLPPAGLYTSGVGPAGEEAQDGRSGAKRFGDHHGHWTEGTKKDKLTVKQMDCPQAFVESSFSLEINPGIKNKVLSAPGSGLKYNLIWVQSKIRGSVRHPHLKASVLNPNCSSGV